MDKPGEECLVEQFCGGLTFTPAQAGNTPNSGLKSSLIFTAWWQNPEHQGCAPKLRASVSAGLDIPNSHVK